MPKVVSVRFHGQGKAYDFSPGEFMIKTGDCVVVETVQGMEFGVVASDPAERPTEQLHDALKPILRPATDEDISQYEKNCDREREAYRICCDLIEKHGLEMRLVTVEYTFDEQKILFYFTADNRVDFRELVRDLAQVFRRRIELRQIGVRDEARMVGGVGVCGRPFCCATFLDDFVPVSVKMAKMQNLSMNPAKISGSCGRLMCCLKYEQAAYEEARKRMPRQGAIVHTPKGEGRVVMVDLLRERVTVQFIGQEQNENEFFPLSELTWDKDLKNIRGKGVQAANPKSASAVARAADTRQAKTVNVDHDMREDGDEDGDSEATSDSACTKVEDPACCVCEGGESDCVCPLADANEEDERAFLAQEAGLPSRQRIAHPGETRQRRRSRSSQSRKDEAGKAAAERKSGQRRQQRNANQSAAGQGAGIPEQAEAAAEPARRRPTRSGRGNGNDRRADRRSGGCRSDQQRSRNADRSLPRPDAENKG